MNSAGWLAKAEAYLHAQKTPEARASVEFLLADAMGVGRAALKIRGAEEVTDKAARRFWNGVIARGKRMPIAYIVGNQPFLGLKIEVTRDSLIPRPETEELVLECERLLKSDGVVSPRILEIGTGTGCIAIALAQLLPQATVFATDVSEKALSLAIKNALANHVSGRIRFIGEDMYSERPGLRAWADMLVSNPPYIPTAELDHLEPEVQHEPRLALDGGKDGLTAIRAIIGGASRSLKVGGRLALEIGDKQGAAVAALMRASSFGDVFLKRDAQGVERIAVGKMIE